MEEDRKSIFTIFWKEYSWLCGMAFLAISYPLLATICGNPEFFTAHRIPVYAVILSIVSIALLPGMLLAGIRALLVRFTPEVFIKVSDPAVTALLTFVMVMNLLNKNLFNKLSGDLVECVIYLIVSLLAAIAAFLAFRKDSLRDFFRLSTALIVILPIYFVFFSPAQKFIFKDVSRKNIKKYSRIQNPVPVTIVIFDELGLWALLNSQGKIDSVRYPNFSRLASSSNWYCNARTVCSQTYWAIPAIVTGTAAQLCPEKLSDSSCYPDNLFTFLADNEYKLNVSEWLTAIYAGKDSTGKFRLGMYFSDLIALPLHSYLHQYMEKRILPPLPARWCGFGFLTDNDMNSSFYDKTIGNIIGGQKSLNYLHFDKPHRPILYLPSGSNYINSIEPVGCYNDLLPNSMQPDLINFASHQYLLQCGFVDRLLGKVIDEMKAKGIFDESLLIVMGDHGVSYYPGEYKRASLSNVGLSEIGFIPLFVKLPGQKQGKVIKKHVTSIDVFPTICEVLDAPFPWNVDGISMLAQNFPSIETYNRKNKRIYFASQKVDGNVVGYKSYSFIPIKKTFNRLLKRKAEIFEENTPFNQSNTNYTGIKSLNKLLGKDIRVFPKGRLSHCSALIDYNPPVFLSGKINGLANTDVSNTFVAAVVDDIIVSLQKPSEWQGIKCFFSVMLPEINQVYDRTKLYLIQKSGELIYVNKVAINAVSLKKRFEQCSHILLQLNQRIVKKIIPDAVGVKLVESSDSRIVLDTKYNGFMYIPFRPPAASSKGVIIKLDIELEKNAAAVFYYLLKGQKEFNDHQFRSSDIPEGRRTLYIPIPMKNLVNVFKFSTGMMLSGKYIIHSMEIRDMQ